MLNRFVDKTGRKPSGWLGKRMYSNPRGHCKSFRLGCTPVSIQLVKKQYLKLSVFSPPSPFLSPFPSRSLWESGTLWQNVASFCCIRPL